MYWTTYQYDLLNRITQVSRPISDSNPTLQTTYIYYEGLTTRTVDPLSKQSTKIANVGGAMVRSSDHDGYYQTFDYDPFGNALRVTDSLANTLQSNTFNIRGMRTAQTDMDAGSWSFTPNALGEIISQTDAKSQTTTFVHDALGRLYTRTEAEGVSNFVFGTSAVAKNIGKLASMSGPGYSEGYTYDSVGRLQQRSITSDATYAIDYSYNSIGALNTLTYPTSTSSYRLKLQYDYQYGQLLRVKDYNAPSTVFWTANDVDPRGNVVNESWGNGIQTIRSHDNVTGLIDFIQSGPSADGMIQNLSYTWNEVGSLTQRQDVRQGLTENFYYDNLHRLTSVTGPGPMTIGYDAMGNITSKTGVGTYTYHATKKHAVTAAGSNSYGYDANGNVNSRNGFSISWYSYDLPNLISGPSSDSSQFFYGPDRARWKQVASYAGTSEQTIYVGGLIEKVTLGATTSWKHYIAGGTGPVAIYTRKSTGTNEIHYLTKDHLGSIDSVTNASGAVEVRTSFGSFGQRRNEAGWSGNPTSGDWTQITNTSRRGFTFHEMLDNLNLTHMNGRVYDQIAGRFLSADPIVQAPGFTQSFNRYSYTFNNPLSYTDPSGYEVNDWAHRTFLEDMVRLMQLEQTITRMEQHLARYRQDDPTMPQVTAFPSRPPRNADPVVPPRVEVPLADPDWTSTGGGTRPSISEALANTNREIAELEALLAMGDGTVPRAPSAYYSDLANNWWPGYSLGTCIYEGCSGLKWAMAGFSIWPGSKAVRIGRNWAARDIADVACERGCEAIAKQVQRHIGGDIVRITPQGAPMLGAFRGKNWGWGYHEVVVKDGRVYDITTGHQGLSIEEYKKLWQYSDAINFGF